MNSAQATQFRIWATQPLREFIVKGFVLDDERLELNKPEDRLLIENADGRKATGRPLEELRAVMEPLPQTRIGFDVAHAYQVDPTWIEARRMIRVFGSRIVLGHWFA